MSRQTIYIFFGLIASGKSTLAEMFTGAHHFPWYNTDRVRKELAGLRATERRPDGPQQGIYTPEFTEKTYREMLARAELDLQQGSAGVVLDGSYSKRSDRTNVVTLAGKQNAEVLFILCFCSDKEVRHRLELRAKDPAAVSDGRWEIFVRQKETFEFPDELDERQLVQLDTEDDPKQLLIRLENFCNNRT